MRKESIIVQPIYGWGWFNKEGTSLEVPPSFQLDIDNSKESKLISGKINQPNHEYDGWWATLELRSRGADGNSYNVTLSNKKPEVQDNKINNELVEITGYSKLSE